MDPNDQTCVNFPKIVNLGETLDKSWVRTVYPTLKMSNGNGADNRGKERDGAGGVDSCAYVCEGEGGRANKNFEHECYPKVSTSMWFHVNLNLET